MKYALLVYDTPEKKRCVSSPEFLDDPRVTSFVRLSGVDVSTTVRLKESRTIISDGPFAETQEVFGGLIVIEAEHLDDALAFAKLAAAFDGSTIEVRPLAL